MAQVEDLIASAWSVRQAYERLETVRYGRPWTREEVALGLVGDVGDLMKLIQAAEGVRAIPNSRARLAHEFADCLWSILVLAKLYGVDLEASFHELMDALSDQIAERLATPE